MAPRLAGPGEVAGDADDLRDALRVDGHAERHVRGSKDAARRPRALEEVALELPDRGAVAQAGGRPGAGREANVAPDAVCSHLSPFPLASPRPRGRWRRRAPACAAARPR